MNRPTLPLRVVSYAFFRDPGSRFERADAGVFRGRFFACHLPLVIRACAANFPGWQIRIHHDASVWDCAYGGALQALEREGLVRLVDMGRSEAVCRSMLWRMEPLFDPNVGTFICRDLDSIVSRREAALVQEWLASGLAVHAIHDHPYHVGSPLMGGMTGYRPEMVRHVTRLDRQRFDQAVAAQPSMRQHGDDQRFLNRVLWPLVRGHTFMHQLSSSQDEGAARTEYAGPRQTGPHVGAVFTEYDGAEYRGPTFDPETVARRLFVELQQVEAQLHDHTAAVIRRAEHFNVARHFESNAPRSSRA